MAYIALKPCSFAGQKFFIDNIIPDELIHPGNVNNLVKMGMIAKAPIENSAELPETAQIKEEGISITVHAKDGDLPLNLTKEGLQAVIDVITGTVDNAEPIIEEITDGDALILLHITDSRKTIKEAAEARAKELSAKESAGEQ